MRSTSSSSTAQPGAQQQSQSQSQSHSHGHQKKPIYFGPFEVTNQVFLTTPHSFALVNLKPLLPGHVLVCPLVPHRRLTDLSPVELTDLFTTVQRVQRMLARHYFLPPASSSSPSSAAASLPPPPPPSPPSSSSSSSTPSAASQPSPAGQQQQQQQQQQRDGQAPLREGGGGAEERGSFNIALQDGPEAGQTVAHVHVHVIPRIRGATAKPASTPSDAIYEQMAAEEGNVGGALWDRERQRESGGYAGAPAAGGDGGGGRPVPGGGFPRIEDAARVARGMEEMEEEAGIYRRVLEQMEAERL
ncbi:HIT-like domain-containing protein [Thermothelomyces heterothallicus CBS 202.75]|uniref:HIT-like domain-containing protein n=1 Tax=Thermothelomyces heterothallicus CBS 202.75 TaxID=1149848 RepID=UPI003742E5F9